ncbi:hypothetical protein QBC38DRAFT_168289 [Podospora fimiseda]|uniref:Uncharacterized protein n=1 Tax=Podospora fimiseda TaxID=252190 RepID=A0AAN7BRB0_9PEZI|nr:hypothetical protein QBC38DRAFT_168289 [Podospora fimiseda]
MAQNVESKIKYLLDLKQLVVSSTSTWESALQTKRSITQGWAVMLFTVITIIFLPLSFMSSIFGINNKDFGSADIMTLKEQLSLTFLISGLVVLGFLVIAFSRLLNLFIWMRNVLRFVGIYLARATGLYWSWKLLSR